MLHEPSAILDLASRVSTDSHLQPHRYLTWLRGGTCRSDRRKINQRAGRESRLSFLCFLVFLGKVRAFSRTFTSCLLCAPAVCTCNARRLETTPNFLRSHRSAEHIFLTTLSGRSYLFVYHGLPHTTSSDARKLQETGTRGTCTHRQYQHRIPFLSRGCKTTALLRE